MHNCIITGQGFRTAKSGNTMFFITFDVEGQNYPRKSEWALTEKNVPYVLDKLARLGVSDITSWGQLDPGVDGFIDLTGVEVALLNTPEPNAEGVVYDRFDLPPMKSDPKPIEKASKKAVRDLDILFGKALKAKFGGSSKPEKPDTKVPLARQPDNTINGVGTGNAPSAEEDDSIPFSWIVPLATALVFSGLIC